MSDDTQPLRDGWHLDRKVPIALLLAILLQAAAWLWWSANLARDVQDAQRRIDRIERSDDAQTDTLRMLREQLARIDERLIAVLARLQAGIGVHAP